MSEMLKILDNHFSVTFLYTDYDNILNGKEWKWGILDTTVVILVSGHIVKLFAQTDVKNITKLFQYNFSTLLRKNFVEIEEQ